MLLNYLEIVKKKRGFFVVARIREGGTRATPLLFCFLVSEFVRQKFRPAKRGHGGRGVWGEFRRARARSNCEQPRRSAGISRIPQKNTLFIRRKRNPARAQTPAVFRKYYKTAGIAT